MDKDSLAKFNIDQNYPGTQIIPSEIDNICSNSFFKNFSIVSKRMYSSNALLLAKQDDQLSYRYQYGEYNHAVSYFYMQIIFQPIGLSISDEVFNGIQATLVHSVATSKSSVKGNRPGFVGKFEEVAHPVYGDVYSSKVLVGTTVFQDDYHVVDNYPASFSEMEQVVAEIYESLVNSYPECQFEVNFEPVELKN